MERSSQAIQGYKLESQIRQAYGRVTYTQTCHEKKIKRLLIKNENIKIAQIILSAMTTGSFVVTLISDEKISAMIGSSLSLILLILNTYVKNFNLTEMAQEHQKALKTEEEQTFSEKEIDVMLPNSIRRCNRNISDV